ncbi:elongation factor 1-beta [Haladaptatus sp. F3-133]|uniref:Elongation factor 1-beta n=1 Tax=Halorutilus salinus TaxID=2487751 RepID=A0A9Q4GFQ5_9EURY|nr:elongation factor 1-beta [Halorutilus salinus]MCX2817807.1 elongation factor 1-beta [Halorutilus salinus]
MGKVIAQIKVMPDDADTNLDALEDSLKEALPEEAELNGIKREDVAFGLVALLVNVGVEDEAGGTEAVEESFAGIEDVESVSVEDVGRV